VRRAFTAFLTAADVFASLAAFGDNLPIEDLEPALRAHARSTLMSDGLIYFAEAGHGDSSGVQVHEVAIDLPVLAAGDELADEARDSLIRLVLNRAEHVLKPSVTTQKPPRHLIITGDPGNGKTTLSRLLVQVYRAALLDGAANLSADQQGVIAGTAAALRRFGRSLPRHRRWPIRIDLAEYAQERGHLIEDSLVRWIAEKVSARSDLGKLTPRALLSWRKQWPWFVVLDGLDEVTEPSVRRTVIERVVEFVNDAEGDDCDVFVVLTTRPVGYTENLAPTQFETIALADLTVEEAVHYGTMATKVRLRGDVERCENVIKRLKEAAESESLRNLLRTPLQVLILTIIIDNSAGNLAPDRYSLFWGYYNTVFSRELTKKTTLRTLLRDHGPQIQQLHERVGFQLQVRSEEGGRSFAALTADELKEIAWHVLLAAGHKPGSVGDSLLNDIYRAATERLVLIAPRGNHGFGFDVRSLQELMAAMHLTNGSFDHVSDRLRLIAASPHWRNTWIFAAGRIFASRQEHQLPLLVDVVEQLDAKAPQRLGKTVHVGPRLALALLDDGMARSWPAWRDRLLAHGLRVLHEPIPPDLPALTRVLVRFADTGNEQRTAVANGIRHALARSQTTRETVEAMQSLIPTAEAQLKVHTATIGLTAVRKPPNTRFAPEPVAAWDEFDDEIATAPIPADAQATLAKAAAAIRDLATAAPLSEPLVDAVKTALTTPNSARWLDDALTHVVMTHPTLLRILRDEVLPDLYRIPVGAMLTTHEATSALRSQ
jgi:hypothetical protein